jgi:hypothetical protein
MTESDLKADLRRYLQDSREALLWKLDAAREAAADPDELGSYRGRSYRGMLPM